MPQYCDGTVDNWNVEILFYAMERVKEAQKQLRDINLKDSQTKVNLEDLCYFERVVADRALWLRDRALTHAVEFLAEPL